MSDMAVTARISKCEMDQDELSQLKRKYEESEKNLVCLKKLAHAAVADYDNLRCKYDQNQKQYEALKNKLKETEDNLSNLQRVLEPACDQFNALSEQLTVEVACRNEAEKFAAKAHKEKNILKRQSQMLLDQLSSVQPSANPLAILETIPDTEVEMLDSSERDVLTTKITSLEEQVKKLESKLEEVEGQRIAAVQHESDATNKCKRLEEEFRKVFKQLQDREQAMASIAYASELALDEFDALKSKYTTQLQLREEAEKLARKMFADNESLKRTSTLLMDKDVLADARLMRALMQVEDLTKELETLKQDNKQKIAELELSVSSDENVQKIGRLEIEVQLLNAEIARLRTCLTETEEWKEKLVKENEELAGKLDEALRPPPPPPPPVAPPCPLLPVFSTTQKLVIKKSSGTANQQQDGGEAAKPSANKTVDSKVALMDEMKNMMNRITTGAPLSAATGRRPSVPHTAPVVKQDHMNELSQLLGKLKKRKEGDESSNVSLMGVGKPPQSLQSPSLTAIQRSVSTSVSPANTNKQPDRFSFDTAAASPPTPVRRSTSARTGPPTAAKPSKSPATPVSIRNSSSSTSGSPNVLLSPTALTKVNEHEIDATRHNGSFNHASAENESDTNSNL